MTSPENEADGLGSPQSQSAQPDKIPPLTNIAPCVFTPLAVDITQPLSKPLDRVGRLRHIIETIDIQNVAVRENLIWMLDRERQRIIHEAKAAEASQGVPNIRPGLPPDEADQIIASMMAPMDSRITYNLPELPSPDLNVLPSPQPNATIRERALHDIMQLVERSVDQLVGYETFMAGVKAEYLTRLEVELTRFGPPEGGGGQDQPMADASRA